MNAQQEKPSKLAEKRRWINTTKLTQSVHNFKNNEFVRIPPQGCVEGAQFEHSCKHPNFKETLSHLTTRDLKSAIAEEKNMDLLVHLSNVERYSDDPRADVMEAFTTRIKKLRKKKDDEDARISKEDEDSQENAGQPQLKSAGKGTGDGSVPNNS